MDPITILIIVLIAIALIALASYALRWRSYRDRRSAELAAQTGTHRLAANENRRRARRLAARHAKLERESARLEREVGLASALAESEEQRAIEANRKLSGGRLARARRRLTR